MVAQALDTETLQRVIPLRIPLFSLKNNITSLRMLETELDELRTELAGYR